MVSLPRILCHGDAVLKPTFPEIKPYLHPPAVHYHIKPKRHDRHFLKFFYQCYF